MDCFRLASLVTFALSQIAYIIYVIIEKYRRLVLFETLVNSFKLVRPCSPIYIYTNICLWSSSSKFLIGPGCSIVEIYTLDSIVWKTTDHAYSLSTINVNYRKAQGP